MIDDDAEKTKLIAAAGEISDILRRHDFCGHVVVIGRGRTEMAAYLDASWSNLTLVQTEHGHGIRLRSMRADYTDKEQRRRELEFSVGAVHAIAHALGMAAMAWIEAGKVVDDVTGAEHTAPKHEQRQ